MCASGSGSATIGSCAGPAAGAGATATAGASTSSPPPPSPPDERKCARTLFARSSSRALECDFLSCTPIVGRKSMTALLFTSSSRASSLIRIELICPLTASDYQTTRRVRIVQSRSGTVPSLRGTPPDLLGHRQAGIRSALSRPKSRLGFNPIPEPGDFMGGLLSLLSFAPLPRLTQLGIRDALPPAHRPSLPRPRQTG